MSTRRLRPTLVLLIIVFAALVLLAGSQTWFTLGVQSGTGAIVDLDVVGSDASPASAALALAALALAVAVAIAGRVIRVVLGFLGVLVGSSLALAAALSLADPVAASAAQISGATGIGGAVSIAELVRGDVETGAWPTLSLASGVVIAALGVVVIATASRWPSATKRYRATEWTDDAASPVGSVPPNAESTTTTPTAATASETATGVRAAAPEHDAGAAARGAEDAVDAWDSLSRGQDPTDDDDPASRTDTGRVSGRDTAPDPGRDPDPDRGSDATGPDTPTH